jgi:hypothetical protein
MQGARSLVWRRGGFSNEDERAWHGLRELPSDSDSALFRLSLSHTPFALLYSRFALNRRPLKRVLSANPDPDLVVLATVAISVVRPMPSRMKGNGGFEAAFVSSSLLVPSHRFSGDCLYPSLCLLCLVTLGRSSRPCEYHIFGSIR